MNPPHPLRRQDRGVAGKEVLEAILQTSDACHWALFDGQEPYLVTLNYGWTWENEFPTLWFHSAPVGRKLSILADHPRICFSVEGGHELARGDRACDFGMRYQSLVGYGVVSTVTDDHEKKVGLDAIMAHYTGQGSFEYDPRVLAATTVLKLTVTELQGKIKA